MKRTMLNEMPTMDEIYAVVDAADRFVALCRLARRHGTLPREYAAVRASAAIAALEGRSRKQCWLAELAGIGESTLSRILKGTR